jgi:hypothetical protein
MAGCGRIGFDQLDIGNMASGGSAPRGAGSASGGSSAPDGALSGGGNAGMTTGSGGISSSDASAGAGGVSGTGGNAGAGGVTSTGGTSASGGTSANGGTAGAGGVVGTGGVTGTAGVVGTGGAGGSQSLIVDLTDPTQTVRSGTATIGTGELDLTLATRDAVGSAFLPTPYALTSTTSFSVSFSFRCYGAVSNPGDGFAFLWHNDPRGNAALGVANTGLNYGGITPSVIVEFDVFANSYDPGANDIAITTNGQYMTALAHQFAPFTISDGATHYAWVDYDGATKTVSVYAGNTPTRPATPLVTATVDLFVTLGAQAYVGFAAGTGTTREIHAIQSLTVVYMP